MPDPTYAGLLRDLIDGEDPNGQEMNWQNYYSDSYYQDLLHESKTALWNGILQNLKNQSPIGDETPLGQQSLFKHIADNIDLTNNSLSSLESMWNDSVVTAINNFEDTFSNAIVKDSGGESVITLEDIKNANAGNSFSGDPYVIPNKNIDGQKYIDVRGDDKIVSVLNNSSELQYTHTAGNNKWIRLLMPKYLRSVEVEDLNRNFWVIGQTLTAVCETLFGPGIPDLFESLLKEIVGLWENVLYLWATASLLTQKQFDTHYEVVTIPNNTQTTFRKFDYFWASGSQIPNLGNDDHFISIWSSNPTQREADKLSIKNAIIERLQYLKEMYPNSNLVILPEIRENNYKHNYYSRAEYPGIYVYNRETQQEHWHWFCIYHDKVENDVSKPGTDLLYYYYYGKDRSYDSDITGWLILDIARDCKKINDANWSEYNGYLSQMYSILERETDYAWMFSMKNAVLSGDTAYYGMLRPIIGMKDDGTNFTCSFIIDDAAAYTVNSDPSRLFFYHTDSALDPITIQQLLNSDVKISIFGHNTYQKDYWNVPDGEYFYWLNNVQTETNASAEVPNYTGYDLRESGATYDQATIETDCNVTSVDDVRVTGKLVGTSPNTYRKATRSLTHSWVYDTSYDPSVAHTGTVSGTNGYYMGELVTCQNLLAIPEMQVNAVAYWGEPAPTLDLDDFQSLENG